MLLFVRRRQQARVRQLGRCGHWYQGRSLEEQSSDRLGIGLWGADVGTKDECLRREALTGGRHGSARNGVRMER
jgi:hypothetical protein